MTTGIDIGLDFSLVLEKNLGNGEGIDDAQLAAGIERAAGARERLLGLRDAGEVGFPDLPFGAREASEISRRAAAMRRRFSHMLVLGIGGSALGTKAVLEALGGPSGPGGLRLSVADNVDPDVFFPLLASLPMRRTAVVAISKSGATAETNAQLAIAMEAVKSAVGRKWAEHFVLVTDPRKGIFRQMAQELGIASFGVPPSVGGRFSVLSPVGLLPLAAGGVSVGKLLDGARRMEEAVREKRGGANPALMAAAVYAHYMIERPKPVQVWFTYGQGLDRVAEWWQQLWGESLGKRRPGGLPFGQTPVRAVGVTDQHSQIQLYQDGPADKIYTFLRWASCRSRGRVPRAHVPSGMAMLGGRPLGDLFGAEFEGTSGALWKAGRPVVRADIGRRDEAHVGAFLQLWEWITALVGLSAGVDPFDQPGVEEGKRITRALMGEKGSDAAREDFRKSWASRVPAEVRFDDPGRRARGGPRGRG